MTYGNGDYLALNNYNYNSMNSGHWIGGTFGRYIASSPLFHTNVAASSSSPKWLAIQIPDSIILKKYRIYTGRTDVYLQQWQLFGSNDIYGTTWTELDSRDYSTPIFHGKYEYREFTVHTTESFNVFKINATKSTPHIIISELILFGEPDYKPSEISLFDVT